MLRSISFVIEGMVPTQVRVTGNLDGTLSFEITRLGRGSIGDLGAVFLDLNRCLDGEGFKVFGDAGLTVGAYAEQGVDTLGRAAEITQAVVDELGDFDIGIAFGALDPDRGAPRTTGFTLAHDTAPLTLGMLDLADFGLRYTWPGAGCVGGLWRQTSGGRAQGAAGWDALEVIEIVHVRARPLANDSNGGVLAVIDLQDAQETAAAFVGEPDRVCEDRVGADRVGADRVGAFGGFFTAAALLDRGIPGGVRDADVGPRARRRPTGSWDGLHPLM